ncbi:TonB-dependent receptor [Herminiimonas fonticola]|uniref:Catecholate siderophore receptor n=1 Tax=Herminiimonas fonticola TaxID=303380 RepID=A0A4R6GHD8_9BURK|nr:TonB-dependent siderophore receptor [Herminiimonas fonticola]RBA24633.1 TonB-siderophor: TonB-dependent siderophore receptor [Herminiimonas fonticola]TDN93750.1 catecholate siderophore receptor [Herminiimonas fonticola]
MNRHLTPLAAALLAAFSTPAAFAQTAPTEATLPAVTVQAGEQTYNTTTSTSATKIDAPLRDIPQIVNIVPQELMRDKAVRSMEDAVKSVPGVGLSHGDGQRDQVTIRGFTAIGDQFVDGVRDDALYFRDMSNVEQVEVVKGPASVLYGRGSSGGLINRVTKKPGMDKNEAMLQVGSWNQRRGEFDLARNYEESGVAFRVTGAVERADSYRDQQFLEREAFAPSLLLKLGDNTKLLLQAEYLHDKRVTDFGIPSYQGLPVNVAPSTYYGAANARDNDYSDAKVTSTGFTLDHRFNNEWSIRNTFRYYEYSLARYNTNVSAVNETTKRATLSRGNVQRDESGYFNQTELMQKVTLAGMQHQMLYGVEIGQQNKNQRFLTQNNIATVDLFNPVNPVVPFTVTAPTSTTDNKGILTTASAYVQDLVTLSEKWKALAGIRYDSFKQETQQHIAGQANLNRTDTAWSPRVGLVYQPSTTQSYYASVSKSFQPSAETFALAANAAQLAPEETTSKEIGAKFDLFDGRASATASLFQLDRTNIKSSDPTKPGVLVPIGEQRTDGIELTFTGDLSGGWQIWSGYAYLDARVAKSPSTGAGNNGVKVPLEGKRATLTAEHSANIWLTKALGHGFSAGAGVNYVGDRFADPANTVTLPSYTTMDAMVAYRIKGFDLQLNVNNLFDREYIISGHGTSANLNLPGAPRNVQLTARYAF